MNYYFDLHFHSCLSPCGDAAMTPAAVAGLCKLAGLDIAALTDHNTCGNCRAYCEAAAAYGLLGLAGMELCTLEEVHVVCLFPDIDRAEAFSAAVRPRLGGRRNDAAIFGPQVYMDAEDNALGEEPLMLAGASEIGVYEVAGLAAGFGGVAYPAHVDRPSFSLLSNLGLWDPELGFPLAERSRNCPPGFLEQHPDLMGVRTITGSDAHYVEQIMDAHQSMELEELTAAAVLDWLRGGEEKQ